MASSLLVHFQQCTWYIQRNIKLQWCLYFGQRFWPGGTIQVFCWQYKCLVPIVIYHRRSNLFQQSVNRDHVEASSCFWLIKLWKTSIFVTGIMSRIRKCKVQIFQKIFLQDIQKENCDKSSWFGKYLESIWPFRSHQGHSIEHTLNNLLEAAERGKLAFMKIHNRNTSRCFS